MKNPLKYLISLLLLAVFSLKIAIPVCVGFGLYEKVDVEHAEEKASEDNNADKSSLFKDKLEVADFALVQPFISLSVRNDSFLRPNVRSFLPVQYASVPTPPPWNRIDNLFIII